MAAGRAFHAVLLAGGSGTRFWPLSRARRPKQFLVLAGRESLIAATWRRALSIAGRDRIWVVAPEPLARDVKRELPDLQRSNLILEPTPRDTAPAIALACATIARQDSDAIVGIFPTDHVVRDRDAFARSVRSAIPAARRGALVCLGVRPDRPAAGFGYLVCAVAPRGIAPVAVARFVEKPDESAARRLLRSGRCLWNGGMFVWGASRFLAELGRTAPGIRRAVEQHLDGRKNAWTRAERRSVDYAVMEKATGVEVVPLDAGWSDVGSWDAAARLREESGGAAGDTVVVGSLGSAVFGAARMVAIVDVPGVVVVDTPDALLVVSRSASERVKAVVEELRQRGRRELL